MKWRLYGGYIATVLKNVSGASIANSPDPRVARAASAMSSRTRRSVELEREALPRETADDRAFTMSMYCRLPSEHHVDCGRRDHADVGEFTAELPVLAWRRRTRLPS